MKINGNKHTMLIAVLAFNERCGYELKRCNRLLGGKGEAVSTGQIVCPIHVPINRGIWDN
jgi:hypothetical protein